MGNPKQKWTAEEEAALLNGVAKYGPGRWKSILLDPDFAPFLTQRSNIDLKDKWRNLSVGNGGQGSRDRSRGAKKVKPLIKQGKPEKNGHRVNRDGALGTKTRTLKQKCVKPKHKYNQALVEAAAAAAYKVVEAENRSFLAAEAVKELERVSEIAENTYGMLQLLKEIHEHCLQGEVALLA